ncbi:MAG: hypothetical protein JNJ57_16860 [Saprospiraceae bacterium]|nr:hypothetical protein [Saprospiraceae bacterium]
MLDQDTFLIKNYLLGLLTAQQRQELERRVNSDTQFAEELRFHRALFAELEHKDMLELKKMLQQEESKYQKPPTNRWPFWVLLALSVGVAIYWIFPSSTPDLPAQNPQPAEQPANEPPQDSKDAPEPPKPLADASKFTPNAAWEAQINSQLRSATTDSFALSSPLPAAVWSISKVNRVHFKGAWYADRDEAELILTVFNNRDAQPLLTQKTALRKLHERLDYDQHILVQQGAGLYYFTIEDATDGTVLKSGKFTFR